MLLCIIAILNGENPTLMPWPTSSVPISPHSFFVSLLTTPCTSHGLSSFSQQDHSHLRKFLVGIFPSQSILPHCLMTCFSPHLQLYKNATSLEKSSFAIQSKISPPNPLTFLSILLLSFILLIAFIIIWHHTYFQIYCFEFFWSLSPLEGSHDIVEHLIAFLKHCILAY